MIHPHHRRGIGMNMMMRGRIRTRRMTIPSISTQTNLSFLGPKRVSKVFGVLYDGVCQGSGKTKCWLLPPNQQGSQNSTETRLLLIGQRAIKSDPESSRESSIPSPLNSQNYLGTSLEARKFSDIFDVPNQALSIPQKATGRTLFRLLGLLIGISYRMLAMSGILLAEPTTGSP